LVLKVQADAVPRVEEVCPANKLVIHFILFLLYLQRSRFYRRRIQPVTLLVVLSVSKRFVLLDHLIGQYPEWRGLGPVCEAETLVQFNRLGAGKVVFEEVLFVNALGEFDHVRFGHW
jgi:hypothetical protein